MSIHPEDGDVLAEIANVYFELEDYQTAERLFLDALKYLPEDPFVMSSYAYSLIKAGKEIEGTNILIELFDSYPLLYSLFTDIENMIQHLITTRTPDETIFQLLEKWKSRQ